MVKVGGLKRKRLLLFGVLLLAAATVALIFRLSQEGPGQGSLRDMKFTVSVQGLELEHGSDGKKAWRLTAPRSEYSQEEAVFHLQDPSLEFLSRQNQEPLLVQARQGTFDQDRQSARFRHGVKADYQDMLLQAEAMQYVENLGWVVFQGPVFAQHPSLQVLGSQARFEMQAEKVVVQGQVQAELYSLGTAK
ncbi:MAG: LPS export ABC transporter periplasmic protein LptC [Desulfohalobiaceae bacterium]